MGLMLINNAMIDLIKKAPLSERDNRGILRSAIIQLQAELDKVYSIALIELDNVANSQNNHELVHRLENLPSSLESGLRQLNIRTDLIILLRKMYSPLSPLDQWKSHPCDTEIENIVKGIYIIGDKILKIGYQLSSFASDINGTHDINTESFKDQLLKLIDTERNKINASKDFLAEIAKDLMALILGM